MHNRKLNKIRYDDLGKLMKQISFRSRTKPLNLDSTILVDELTAETFYRLRTSEIYERYLFCTDPGT